LDFSSCDTHRTTWSPWGTKAAQIIVHCDILMKKRKRKMVKKKKSASKGDQQS
jgi:hypothetical protein